MKHIKLTRGFVTKVDDEDFDRLSKIKWYANVSGTSKKKTIYAYNWGIGFLHHQILPAKDGFDIDHINQDSLDNRRSNLRYLTHPQNLLNSPALNIEGQTSKFRGVHKTKTGWRARIKINGKSKSLGTYSNEDEAAQAYEKAREAALNGADSQEEREERECLAPPTKPRSQII
jgi:hypothetical protein